ncbi:ABC transporter substrate-binding protein [Ruania rhizosphaerae]|uniref:ABC transporter substrate-binding protein n=1 Tax=Ruania rhizosphaerae TaxID=1840413 RepID=UPI001359710D|nr:ABC transporter substrate-binding protein [Ruania rhizosphaerae]
MTRNALSRRQLMGGAGLTGMAGLLAACSGESPPPDPAGGGDGGGGGGGNGEGLSWWDHFGGLQDLHNEWATTEGDRIGVPIEYSYNEPSQTTEALQVANQTDSLPDVFSNVLGLPLPALVEAGWLSPITLSDEAMARLPEGTFTEGITMMDGEIYGLPALSDRQYWACTWYNSEIAEEVGFEPPSSYDEMRAALQAIADHGEYAPMTLALGAAGRIRDQVDGLAQGGGFPGWQGLRYDTGEYEYQHDTYINAIELLKEISDNGWLLPGTNSFQIPDARGRWAAGQIGFFIDGPWSPGGVRSLNAEHLPRMAVAGMLTPGGEELIITRGAPAPTWFIAGSSANPEAASQLVETFTRDDYQRALAEAMDQPPLNLDVVAEADVIDPYAWLIEDFKERVFRAPEPEVRNVAATEALARTTPIAPHLGDIIQGYLGGDISDLQGELVKLSDAFNSDLDSAIESAAAEGFEVSRDDWAFSDWERGTDYTY